MRITYKGDYALKTILDLALHYNQELVTIHAMAKRLDIPVKFLEQILLDLKKGGFVESRRGKVGGYLLAKPPAQIKLSEVIRFIDGPLEPIACVEKGYAGCHDLNRCVFRAIWQELNRATNQIIDALTFQELADRIRRQKESITYHI